MGALIGKTFFFSTTLQQTQVVAAVTIDVFPEHSPDAKMTFKFVRRPTADEQLGSIVKEDSRKATASYFAGQPQMMRSSILPVNDGAAAAQATASGPATLFLPRLS